MDKYISGIWDCDKADSRLGSFLIFQEELLLKCKISNLKKVQLTIIGEKIKTRYTYWETLSQLNSKIYSVTFENNLEKSRTSTIYWPPSELFDKCSYTGSTLVLQRLWKKSGELLIGLKSPNDVRQKAQNWISKHVEKDFNIISIHLKNNPNDQQSNANQDAWFEFMYNCYQNNMSIKFVLIGNDKIDTKISELPNVVLSKDNGGNLELDLALIELSSAFMGMSSGPCNMAIFSDKPYLIWKHPGHHEKEMEKEFQGYKQFEFSTKNQKFMQDWDTLENIQREFSNLFTQLNPKICI
jgi:hypothetical protein